MNEKNSLAPYKTTQDGSRIPILSALKDRYKQITGSKTEKPLIIYLGGATGVGKTVLATLYSKEEGISYDVLDLANEAGCMLDLDYLKQMLNLNPDERVSVLTVPKFTTRGPRDTEVHGIDFYFTKLKDFGKLEDNIIFEYKYPKKGNKALYGMPKSVKWPLKHSIDSVTTITGYDAFSKMSQAFPNAVGIWVDANPRDIEAHIKGRSASDKERKSRLESYQYDRQRFIEHRHEVPYSVVIDSLRSLRVDITPDRERLILQELDAPFRQIKAITRWERFLRKEAIDTVRESQQKFDYFL